MKPLTVIATFVARPGKEAELRSALLALVEPTRKEKGCINYDLHVSTEHPALFHFHENWTSKAHLDAHLQSPQIQALLPRIDGLCLSFPEIRILERIA